MDSDICPNSDRLNEFVTGKLVLELHNAVEEHLDQCAACQETVEILDDKSKSFFSGLKQAAGTPDATFEPDLQELVDRAKAISAERGPQIDNAALKDWTGSQPQLASGTVLGNYVLGEPIGGGNMGFVYKAYHKRMKRNVALKFISPHLVQSHDARRRFQREIEAAAKLNHPNVVAAYDADEVDGYCFLVQELIKGNDLREVVKRTGPLPLDQALRYVLHAARGLECAHSVGVVHRDIKPSNLLLDEQDVVHVADLGLAHLEHPAEGSQGDEVSRTGVVAGTPAYMSPEQCLDLRQTDHRTDIYSLGCTLFYLLTGTTAFQIRGGVGALLARHQQPVPTIGESRPDCPIEIDRLCQSMMAPSVEDRPQSMSDVADEVEELLAKLEQGELSPGHRRNSQSRRRFIGVLMLGTVAIVIMLLMAIFGPSIFQDDSKPPGTHADTSKKEGNNAKDDSFGTPKLSSDELAQSAIGIPNLELVRIEPGTFSMGSPAEDSTARSDEKPAHEVTISKPFLLGKFEITVAQFADVMASADNPVHSIAPPLRHSNTPTLPNSSDPSLQHSPDPGRLPISGISWLEAVEFCNRLSNRHGLTPYYEVDDKTVSVRRDSGGFRLPTEAEWEFACRSTSQTPWHFGDDPKTLGEYAWYADNSGGLVHPVGTKKPNLFGLHDMYGNVPEWCWDRFDPDYYAESEAIDPPGSSRGEERVFRGGGANNRASQTRSAVRNPLGATYGFLNNVGLRVARSIQ